jgi:protein-disulfide isomerase
MADAPGGMKRFYAILIGVAVVGLGVLGVLLARPKTVSIPANVTIQASDTAGFRGYLKGSADAPVEITEYADYQCPFCQTFATLQMPTIEERLIRTGRLRWRYRDFPLQLDLNRYDECMKSGKYAGRIQASYEEGSRLGVSSTPTLLVGNRLYQGRLDSDAIRRLVDSLAPLASR